MKKIVSILALTILCFVFFIALFGPSISGYTYHDISLMHKNQAPSLEHWFGTDDLGRDMFTRIAYGARVSLTIGIAAAIIDLFIGVFWGGLAAYKGGVTDEVMMRIADVLYSLPYLLVVIMLMVLLGSGMITMIVALTVTGWITMARIVRAQISELKHREFVLAAQSLGAGTGRILFRHLLPNAMGPIIVTLTLTVPSAIFTEAFLSFLGLGVQAPIASWGTMTSEGLPALHYYPWRLLFPVGFISATMLAFNLIGDSILERYSQSDSRLSVKRDHVIKTVINHIIKIFFVKPVER